MLLVLGTEQQITADIQCRRLFMEFRYASAISTVKLQGFQ